MKEKPSILYSQNSIYNNIVQLKYINNRSTTHSKPFRGHDRGFSGVRTPSQARIGPRPAFLSSLHSLTVATISAICKASPTNWTANETLWTAMVVATSRVLTRSILNQIRHASDTALTTVKITCVNTAFVNKHQKRSILFKLTHLRFLLRPPHTKPIKAHVSRRTPLMMVKTNTGS